MPALDFQGIYSELASAEQRDPLARMRLASDDLYRAWQELYLPSTDEGTKQRRQGSFNAFLHRYRDTLPALPPHVRQFYEPLYDQIQRAQASEDPLRNLREPIYELEDSIFRGVLDLDLAIEEGAPRLFKPGLPFPRNRFMIVGVRIINREKAAVSLWPEFRIELAPDQHSSFDPDEEPLKEWEEFRGRVPAPARRPLPAPLALGPMESAAGYWCFHIDYYLESLQVLLGKNLYEREEPLKCTLYLADQASGRRTKGKATHIRPILFKPNQ